jgi:hypothetical protein
LCSLLCLHPAHTAGPYILCKECSGTLCALCSWHADLRMSLLPLGCGCTVWLASAAAYSTAPLACVTFPSGHVLHAETVLQDSLQVAPFALSVAAACAALAGQCQLPVLLHAHISRLSSSRTLTRHQQVVAVHGIVFASVRACTHRD